MHTHLGHVTQANRQTNNQIKTVLLFVFFCKGFEKMERGLSERYKDRVSPVKRHMDHMVNIGAAPGLVNPQLNSMTSDVIKVTYSQQHCIKWSPCIRRCRNLEKEKVTLYWVSILSGNTSSLGQPHRLESSPLKLITGYVHKIRYL